MSQPPTPQDPAAQRPSAPSPMERQGALTRDLATVLLRSLDLTEQWRHVGAAFLPHGPGLGAGARRRRVSPGGDPAGRGRDGESSPWRGVPRDA